MHQAPLQQVLSGWVHVPHSVILVGAGVMDGMSVPYWETSTGGSSVGQSPLCMPKTQIKAVIKQGVSKQSELFHNLDPLYHLAGDANESWVLGRGFN